MKKPKRMMDWVGLVVVNKNELSNGWGAMPAGTKFLVTSQSRGLSLVSERCECCGFKWSVSQVAIEQLEVLDIPENVERLRRNEARYFEKVGWGRYLVDPEDAGGYYPPGVAELLKENYLFRKGEKGVEK